jgi:pyruvate dehydrogenase E1 component alpha subunit
MERDTLHRLLRDMLLSRAFEERAAEEYTKGNIVGFLHLYPGEEAVGAGIINAAGPSDYIVSTYREHAHALMRGTPARKVMAELFGRATGMSGGMGGSMHMFDSKLRFMGGYAIVGESCPIALGIAYAVAMRGLPEAVICFFGDGAVNQGTFHESLNMAGLWRLPLLFVCENNHYAIGTEIHRHSAVVEVSKRAAAYNIPAEKVDGMDVLKVYDAHTVHSIGFTLAAGHNSSNATPTAMAAIPWLTRELPAGRGSQGLQGVGSDISGDPRGRVQLSNAGRVGRSWT